MHKAVIALPILLLVACGDDSTSAADLAAGIPMMPVTDDPTMAVGTTPTTPGMPVGDVTPVDQPPTTPGGEPGTPGPDDGVDPGPIDDPVVPSPTPVDGNTGGAPSVEPEPEPEPGMMPGAGGETMMPVEPVEPTCEGPYCPREGEFSMMVYSQTRGFRHSGSINSGKELLQEIADEWGINATFIEDNSLITEEGLAEFELVYFLNPTGDIFNNGEQTIFQNWMLNGGALAGNHSMTDTEEGWAFYNDLTGQYYNGHQRSGTQGTIDINDDFLDHPSVVGLPDPWQRAEEWYNFNTHQQWTVKPGFGIIGRVTAGSKTNSPVIWIREHETYRMWYTNLGHDSVVFENDADVKRHITGGILWSVRRSHWLDQ